MCKIHNSEAGRNRTFRCEKTPCGRRGESLPSPEVPARDLSRQKSPKNDQTHGRKNRCALRAENVAIGRTSLPSRRLLKSSDSK